MLSWLHFGDLHVSQDDNFSSLHDLEKLIADANQNLADQVDFAFLPGDNANNGTADQYRRIRQAVSRLDIPLHVIPGDHDFEPGSLEAFHGILGAAPLPKAIHIDGRRCLFLDIVSPGTGGPDFRLGTDQFAWLGKQLAESQHDKNRPVVFMHAFPGDLRQGAEETAQLMADNHVAFVDTGHTHYNELLNDGAVIYAATRSTGQIEEGKVGFSLVTVDGAAASWRFKALEEPWPLVLITSPSDRRLRTDTNIADQNPRGALTVRAKVFGPVVEDVRLTINGGAAVAMKRVPDQQSFWQAEHPPLEDGVHAINVEAGVARDEISILVASNAAPKKPMRDALGTDRHSLGAWEGHGLLGTQLGPNKNGKKW